MDEIEVEAVSKVSVEFVTINKVSVVLAKLETVADVAVKVSALLDLSVADTSAKLVEVVIRPIVDMLVDNRCDKDVASVLVIIESRLVVVPVAMLL